MLIFFKFSWLSTLIPVSFPLVNALLKLLFWYVKLHHFDFNNGHILKSYPWDEISV